MSAKSKIEWTDATWNPVTGCTKVSPGCKHCYAETFSERFRGVPGNYFERGFDLQLRPSKLDEPKRWKQPKVIFVNSMSDLFHERVPVEYIREVFEVMRSTPRHTYQVLTKRSARMVEVCRDIEIPSNVWMGVSVESADYLWRVDHLRQVEANRFLSCEPLLGTLDGLDLTGIGWVIGGGESGSHLVKHQERRLDRHPEWIRRLRDICERASVPFHFKQWGGHQKAKAGRELDGRTHDDVPGRVRLPVVLVPIEPEPISTPAAVPAHGPTTRQVAAYKAWATMRAGVTSGTAKPKGSSAERVLSMSLDSIVESANRALFRGELPPVAISYGVPTSKNAAGHYDPQSRTIVIREGLPPRELLSTIAHELCHHATRDTRPAHGQAWQRRMIEIGLMPHGTPGHFSESEIPDGMFVRWADSL
jgi:protein gp37